MSDNLRILNDLCPIAQFEIPSDTVADADRKLLRIRDGLAHVLAQEVRDVMSYKAAYAEWGSRARKPEDIEYENSLVEYELELQRQELLPSKQRDIVEPPKAPSGYTQPPAKPSILLLETSIISKLLSQQLSDTLVGSRDLSSIAKAIDRNLTGEDLDNMIKGS